MQRRRQVNRKTDDERNLLRKNNCIGAYESFLLGIRVTRVNHITLLIKKSSLAVDDVIVSNAIFGGCSVLGVVVVCAASLNRTAAVPLPSSMD